MANTKPGQRLVLQLDPRIALEAIILNRYERTPTTRRQEWLRGLLVQGFRSECRVLRDASDDAVRTPTMVFKNGMMGEVEKSVGHPKLEPAAVKVTPSQVDTANKPFAALGRVIG